jgi:aminopeptidase N
VLLIEPRVSNCLLLALALFSGLAAKADAQAPTAGVRAFDVIHYDATVEPNIAEKSVKGNVAISLVLGPDPSGVVDLDIGALTVDSVNEGGQSLDFTQAERRLHVTLKSPARAGDRRRLQIEYHGAPRFGLQFVPEKSQAYTIFSTSQWLVCVDAPSDRATLRLRVVLPKGLAVVANGRATSQHPMQGGRVTHEWRLERPAPTFSFGFAVGNFNEATEKYGRTSLRYLSLEASPQDLRRIFAETSNMIAFFEGRTGVRYPERVYAQALVHETAGQEMSGFSLMSDRYGREVLADPQNVGLMAHELAHQWWGVGLTCEDWTHFWLNEGFATFMAAAYRESRFSRDVYLKDVAGWRARYERIRSAGKDRSLVFPDWNRPTSDDRSLVYQKGALVLHELREALGEGPFWAGIRAYTKASFGSSVTTAAFQTAMEKSTGQDLSAYFNEWVFAITKPRS